MTQKEFLNNVTDWENHRYLLWLALEQTKGQVLEFGCGDGSTPFLSQYCKDKKRKLLSLESDFNYAQKFNHLESGNHIICWAKDWDSAPNPDASVVLIDHAPGERRIIDIEKYKDIKGIIVIHDTQPQPTAADYGYERIWSLFKYKVDLQVEMNKEAGHNRTWASAVSNHIDVTKWAGTETGRQDYWIK